MYPQQDHRAMSPPNGDGDTVDNPDSQYPAQLYNQIDIGQSQYHDPRYAYESTSDSRSTSCPPPPCPPPPPPSPSPGPHTIDLVHSTPYWPFHPDVPARSIWDPAPAADNAVWCDTCSYSHPVDASLRWSPAYNEFRHPPPCTPPAPSYQDHFQSQTDGEQVAVSDRYRQEMPHPHASSIYPHGQHQGVFPLDMLYQDPMSLYHGLGSLENTSQLQMGAVENPDIRNGSDFNPLPPLSEHIDSLPDSIEEDPDYHLSRSSLPGLDTEQALHNMLLEGLLQEHPPPSAMYSEAGPSWVASSPNDDDHHEQRVSPYSVLGLHPPPQFHPAGPQPAHAESSFHSWRQSPVWELLYDVQTPAGETAGAATWRPQISQPDPILWPSHPPHSFPTPAAFDSGDGPSTPPSYLPPTLSNGRISPSPHPGSMQVDEQVPQMPTASQSHFAISSDRTDRTNRDQLSTLWGGGIGIPETRPGAFALHAPTGELPPSPTCAPECSTSVNILDIPIQAFPSSPASPASSSPPPDAASSCGMDFPPQT